jgi:hypothetical protein
MSNKSPKSLSDLIFRPGSALHELARQAGATADLALVLRNGLTPELAGALRSASIHDDGTLVVLASSPAWAARLRFEEARLLALCADQRPPVNRLKVRVSGNIPGSD